MDVVFLGGLLLRRGDVREGEEMNLITKLEDERLKGDWFGPVNKCYILRDSLRAALERIAVLQEAFDTQIILKEGRSEAAEVFRANLAAAICAYLKGGKKG
jgi:hypothetical protein